MSRVYLGKMEVTWCVECQLPLLRGGICPACGCDSFGVKYTPPGDIRPAFSYDIEEARDLTDRQWGNGMGKILFPVEGPYLINPCPSRDRLDEIIGGGRVVADIAFDITDLRKKLILKEEGGRIFRAGGIGPSKGFVIADEGALPYLIKGENLMSPGILDADHDIMKGDEVLVMDGDGNIIGSGTARKSGELLSGTRGQGVKMRWAIEGNSEKIGSSRWDGMEWGDIWEQVVGANSSLIDEMRRRSVDFINETVRKIDLPAAVSFSGGKDSLATLMLCMEAGLDPPLLFVDTGIEFPETVDYVHKLASDLDLNLIEEKPTTGFLENFEKFGPPGRDFRWCCKTNKLGPMTRLIKENFPGGVLTFIGQRRFESSSRQRKGAIWKNPWVPSQVGASPVQNWNGLDIWLYIFKKEALYNPLYERGFERIGCWLCPSTDLAERELLVNSGLDTSWWEDALERERRSRELPEEWIRYGFYRFKVPPPHMRNIAERTGISDSLKNARRIRGIEELIVVVEGNRSCRTGLIKEGAVSDKVPWEHLVNLLNIMGKVEETEEGNPISVWPTGWKSNRPAVEVFRDSAVVIRSRGGEGMKNRTRDLFSIVLRAEGCTGCGVCVGRCPVNAIVIKDGRARIDPERCLHCGKCLGLCPAEDFRYDGKPGSTDEIL